MNVEIECHIMHVCSTILQAQLLQHFSPPSSMQIVTSKYSNCFSFMFNLTWENALEHYQFGSMYDNTWKIPHCRVLTGLQFFLQTPCQLLECSLVGNLSYITLIQVRITPIHWLIRWEALVCMNPEEGFYVMFSLHPAYLQARIFQCIVK